MSNNEIDVVVMSKAEARELTDKIKADVAEVWVLIARAYDERAWEALGYPCWDDYTSNEFATSRLRLPREEREAVVSSLRDSGLSIRAIASGVGIDPKTVQNDLMSYVSKNKPAVGNSHTSPDVIDAEVVAPVIGLDGKKHPRQKAKAPAKKAPAKKARAKAPARFGSVGMWLEGVERSIKGLDGKLDESFTGTEVKSGSLPMLPAGIDATLLKFSDQLDRIAEKAEKIEAARAARKAKRA